MLVVVTLPETNSKVHITWKRMIGRPFSFWGPAYFQGRLAVSFRECIQLFGLKLSYISYTWLFFVGIPGDSLKKKKTIASCMLVFEIISTLPETNSIFATENGWLEDFLVSYWVSAYFQGRTVSFREGTWMSQEVSKWLVNGL